MKAIGKTIIVKEVKQDETKFLSLSSQPNRGEVISVPRDCEIVVGDVVVFTNSEAITEGGESYLLVKLEDVKYSIKK